MVGLDNGKFYYTEMSENSASRTFSIFFYVENNIIHVKKNRKVVIRIIFWHLAAVKFSVGEPASMVIDDYSTTLAQWRNRLALQFS